jgi:hypothetical protein
MESPSGCGERTSDLVSNNDPSKVQAWIVEPGLNVRYRSCGAVSIIGTVFLSTNWVVLAATTKSLPALFQLLVS